MTVGGWSFRVANVATVAVGRNWTAYRLDGGVMLVRVAKRRRIFPKYRRSGVPRPLALAPLCGATGQSGLQVDG